MDIDEAKVYAANYMVTKLVSGKDFPGLGPAAESLIILVAGSADDNAQFISEKTTRTSEAFFEMSDRVRSQFVQEVLGVSDTQRSLIQATDALVESVWQAYIDWAEAAK